MANTSIETSRKFASAFRLGTARSRQRVTGAEAIGPTHFPVGGVDAGTAAIKVAHAILASGAINERRRMEGQLAMEAAERSELELQRARNAVDPGYMTPYQRKSLELREAELNKPPDSKTATPRAPVKLTRDFGRFKAGEEVDPAALVAEGKILTENRLRDSATKRGAATQRYTKARAALAELDAERTRLADTKMFGKGGFEEFLRATVRNLQGGNDQQKKAARATLGIGSFNPTQGEINSALESLRKDYRGSLESAIDRHQSGKRKQLRQVIESEALELAKPDEDPLSLGAEDPLGLGGP